MKTYIYLAEERINSLYEQYGAITYETTSSVGANVLLDASLGSKETFVHTLAERLDVVLSKKDIKKDNLYISASTPMAWNARNRIRSDIQATFWIGEIPSAKDEIYTKTFVLLIGSGKNIIGNKDVRDCFVSASYIDGFFKSMENTLDVETFKRTDGYDGINEERDERILKIISENKDWTIEQKEKEVNHYLKQYDTNKYMEYLLNTYTGNYCEYEFCAQILSSSLSYDNDNELCRYIIAAPLYVSRVNIITERVLIEPNRRMYVLTEKEYFQHKKNKFENLYALLLNSGLIPEEKSFTAEMLAVFEKYGKHSGLEDKKKAEQFINKVIPIVSKYFIVVNKK